MINKYNNWNIYPPRDAWSEIDVTTIKKNTKIICNKVFPSKVMAVVKADGFGHGLVESSKAAIQGGVSNLGVATLDEGIALRKAGVNEPILLLSTIQPRFAELVYTYNISVALCTLDLARTISNLQIIEGEKVNVHIKVNTGLNRIGIPVNEAYNFIKIVSEIKNINIEGIFSTFADADNSDTSYSIKQYKMFINLLSDIKKGGINIDLVRTGRLIYGVTPWLPELQYTLGLKSALSIRCAVVFVSKISKVNSIGFDKIYYARKNMAIATIPIGFADVGRLFQGNSNVIINNKLSKVISIASDQNLVDVTNITDIKIGDNVVVLGKDKNNKIDINNIMERTGLSSGTIFTGLTKRLSKIYLKNGDPYKLNGYLESNP